MKRDLEATKISEMRSFGVWKNCRCTKGKVMMKRRREDIEPTFGDIKRNMNFRTFHLRGQPQCLIELGLVSIGHNLKKIKQQLKRLAEYQDGREQGIRLGTMLGYVS